MDTAVLLYTMNCNIDCAHCSVDSHRHRPERMTLDQARALVRGLCDVPDIKFIDITGGEPLLYPKEIKELAKLAKEQGKQVRVVSNGFWAASVERAEKVIREMRDAGVESIGISIDEWHLKHLRPAMIHNYIAGCRRGGMQPF